MLLAIKQMVFSSVNTRSAKCNMSCAVSNTLKHRNWHINWTCRWYRSFFLSLVFKAHSSIADNAFKPIFSRHKYHASQNMYPPRTDPIRRMKTLNTGPTQRRGQNIAFLFTCCRMHPLPRRHPFLVRLLNFSLCFFRWINIGVQKATSHKAQTTPQHRCLAMSLCLIFHCSLTISVPMYFYKLEYINTALRVLLRAAIKTALYRWTLDQEQQRGCFGRINTWPMDS